MLCGWQDPQATFLLGGFLVSLSGLYPLLCIIIYRVYYLTEALTALRFSSGRCHYDGDSWQLLACSTFKNLSNPISSPNPLMLSFVNAHVSFYLALFLCLVDVAESAPASSAFHRRHLQPLNTPFPYGKLADRIFNVQYYMDIPYEAQPWHLHR